MITGLVEPTRGTVLYNGQSMRSDVTAYKRRLGYVPEEANLYPHLSGAEYLELVGTLRGLDAGVLKRKSDALLNLFGLYGARHSPTSSYSKGMRQKLLISAAVLHDPDVLVLDEPEAGLDVTTTLVFRKFISRLAAEGKIVLYCSHVLEVIEKVCTHVLVLHRGDVVAHETIDGIRRLASKPSLEQVFSELTHQTDTDQTAGSLVEIMRLQ
jgi:ABC-2 type transport system ATP-binding protein